MDVDMRIRLAGNRQEFGRCHAVMAQLRPHLDEQTFVEQVRRQAAQGYRLAYVEDDGVVVTVAGFRVKETLGRGHFLYVEDLVTDAGVRSRGYGEAMFEWLLEYARSNRCATVEVESGVQRFDAHRFYFRRGMHIARYLFSLSTRQ